jgi:UDP-GlcNAc:undecaprenyl-phosphate/decaprenyl-phosphate GlcNAc-1-phosphate transferase
MSASTHPSLEYVLVAGIAAGGTYLATPIARALAVAWGAIARPRDRDVHAVAIPRLGGVAMLAGLSLALFVAGHLPTLSRTFSTGPEIPWIVASGALICLIGALDDRYELDSVTKLAGQVVATGIMVTRGGVQLAEVYVPWGDNGTVSLSRDIAIPVTILLTVLTINAINFIDGLDGLAAGVTAIGGAAFFMFSYHLAQVGRSDIASVPTLLSAALVGTCLGFLPHNFVPARIFMGDSGSMLVGLLLSAAATTATTSTDPQTLNDAGTYLPIVLPLILVVAVLAIPFIDLSLAVIRRVSRGQSPFAPDKRHLHHRLLELGHSHRRAVLLMYFWSALLAFGVTTYSILRGPWVLLVMLGVGAAIGVILLVVPRLRRRRKITNFTSETRLAAGATRSSGGGGAA